MNKCPSCGHKYYKKPIKDAEGKIIWKNLLVMDFEWFIMLIALAMIIMGFYSYTSDLDQVRTDPCGFCAASNCFIKPSTSNYWKDEMDWDKELPPIIRNNNTT